MSDFVNDFWGIYIAIVSVISIAACLWLLLSQSKRRVGTQKNVGNGVSDTGHVLG